MASCLKWSAQTWVWSQDLAIRRYAGMRVELDSRH